MPLDRLGQLAYRHHKQAVAVTVIHPVARRHIDSRQLAFLESSCFDLGDKLPALLLVSQYYNMSAHQPLFRK